MKTLFSILLFLLLAASVVVEFTMLSGEQHHLWNSIPIFYGLFGLAISIGLLLLSIGLRRLLRRGEHYYD